MCKSTDHSIANQMIIWDDSKQRVVITLEFKSAVLRTLLSKSLIVIALRNSIEIYQFSTTPRKIHEFETGDNSENGLVCLGPDIVAFPGRTAGQVQLVDLKTGNVSIIPAHETRLRTLALSRDGLLLATAGEKVSIEHHPPSPISGIRNERRRMVAHDLNLIYRAH